MIAFLSKDANKPCIFTNIKLHAYSTIHFCWRNTFKKKHGDASAVSYISVLLSLDVQADKTKSINCAALPAVLAY